MYDPLHDRRRLDLAVMLCRGSAHDPAQQVSDRPALFLTCAAWDQSRPSASHGAPFPSSVVGGRMRMAVFGFNAPKPVSRLPGVSKKYHFPNGTRTEGVKINISA